MGIKDLDIRNSARWIEYAIERYQTIGNVIGTILVAWLLSSAVGEIISLLIPSPQVIVRTPPPITSISDLSRDMDMTTDITKYMPICERNLFDSQKRTACTEEPVVTEEQKLDPNAPPVKSDMRATLFGTMVIPSRPDASFATIQGPSEKEASTYHIGDELNKEAEIYDIQRNKVFFYRNNRKEYIEVENLPQYQANSPAPSNTPTSGDPAILNKNGTVSMTRQKVTDLMANMTDLLQQARMVPDYQNGVVQGFKVFAIRPGSIFEQMGLKNGDTISQINGTKIDSLEKALPMMELLKTESNISIDISRGGSKQSIKVNIQ